MVKKLRKESEKGQPFSDFTIVTNNIKYLGVTLTNVVKYLFNNSSTSLKKEIEKDARK